MKIANKKKLIWLVGILLVISGIIIFAVYTSMLNSDISSYIKQYTSTQASPFVEINSAHGIDDMSTAAENEHYILAINEKTAEIAIKDKNSGAIYYTNPMDLDTDPLATPATKESMASSIIITVANELNQSSRMSSFEFSTDLGQFTVESIENGVRVNYVIGDLSHGIEMLPSSITPQRLEEKVLSKLSKVDAMSVESKYIEDKDKEGYLLLLASLEKNNIQLNKTLELFYEVAGYTQADLLEDNEMAGLPTTTANEYVEISVDFKLDGDEFVAEVPMDKVVTHGEIKLVSVDLLPYFGAADTTDEGYMLVPSGSGALIELNNGKYTQSDYRQKLYGTDYASTVSKTEDMEIALLPIFGLKTKNQAFLAYITEGDSFASIVAGVSEKNSSYNNVYPSFELRGKEEVKMSTTDGDESFLVIYEEETYAGRLSVHYMLMGEKDVTYSDMAKAYRDVLIQDGTLKAIDVNSVPLYLNVIGSVEKVERIFGVPFNGQVTMTDVEQMNEIVDELSSYGINNVQMKLDGWFGGGVNHEQIRLINLENIGSKNDIESLASSLSDNGGGLYPSLNIGKVAYSTSGFIPFVEGSRNAYGRVNIYTPYSRATEAPQILTTSGYQYFINPATSINNVNKFLNQYNKYDIGNVAVNDAGELLVSDKSETNGVLRETAEEITIANLANMSNQNNVMITGGNAYTLPYVDHIIGLATGSNKNHIIDKDIPFYQMVIHGYIQYGSNPINLYDAYNYDDVLLNLLEYGASPTFIVTAEETINLQDTAYEHYYSTQFNLWSDDINMLYQEVNNVLGELANQSIESHEYITDDVVKVVYSGNKQLIINYGEKSITVDGVSIPSKDYVLMEVT